PRLSDGGSAHSQAIGAALLNEQFGRYQVLRVLGAGGMGTVFEAVHRDLEKRVALKIIHPGIPAQPNAATRVLREGRLAAQVRHPHVVDVLDIGEKNGLHYLVMELLEGETLADRLKREGSLPASQIADIFLPIISAVAAAHEKGIIHRDLKPCNVMLTRRGRHGVHPVILDFGISKEVSDEADDDGLTTSGSIVGTFHYLSPERTRGL